MDDFANQFYRIRWVMEHRSAAGTLLEISNSVTRSFNGVKSRLILKQNRFDRVSFAANNHQVAEFMSEVLKSV